MRLTSRPLRGQQVASAGRETKANRPLEKRVRTLLFLVFLMLAACDDAPGGWSAVVYPDKSNRAKFPLADSCRKRAP